MENSEYHNFQIGRIYYTTFFTVENVNKQSFDLTLNQSWDFWLSYTPHQIMKIVEKLSEKLGGKHFLHILE